MYDHWYNITLQFFTCFMVAVVMLLVAMVTRIALKYKTLGVVDVNTLYTCLKKLIIGLGPAMLLICMRPA